MFCVKCGNKVKDDDKFCFNCGNKIEINEAKEDCNTNTVKDITKEEYEAFCENKLFAMLVEETIPMGNSGIMAIGVVQKHNLRYDQRIMVGNEDDGKIIQRNIKIKRLERDGKVVDEVKIGERVGILLETQNEKVCSPCLLFSELTPN